VERFERGSSLLNGRIGTYRDAKYGKCLDLQAGKIRDDLALIRCRVAININRLSTPQDERIAEYVQLLKAMEGSIRQLYDAVEKIQKDDAIRADLKADCLKAVFPGLDVAKFLKASRASERLNVLLEMVATLRGREN
jgi:hypothetical protein